jgi:hypothetical protein
MIDRDSIVDSSFTVASELAAIEVARLGERQHAAAILFDSQQTALGLSQQEETATRLSFVG